jgi:hypothetical protein
MPPVTCGVRYPQNFPSGFAGHLVDSMEILLHRRWSISWYVRPEVEGITRRIRVSPKVAAEVVLALWLHPHPRALLTVKQPPLLIDLYQ